MTDHLIAKADGVPLKLEVPYVCNATYEIGSFLLYPAKRGFDFNHHGFLVVRDDQYPELPSLLQEWLYFGLLQEFLGRSVELDEFVCTNPDGNAILDTSPLTTYLQSWGSDIGNLGFQKLSSFVRIASEQCRYLDRDKDSATLTSLPAIFLSIHFLIDTLVIAATEFDKTIDYKTIDQRFPLSTELEYSPPSSSILLDHMVQNGWCRYRARLFCQFLPYNVVYYLASFPPNTVRRNHSECEVNNHCVADNVETRNYECPHVDNDCRCEYMSTSAADIKVIIRDGGIPLISFSITPTGVLSHRVIRANHSTKYVAISHVWKDGLGNPHANALPECQIQHLLQTIKRSSFWEKQRNLSSVRRLFKFHQDEHVNVWMDTLCIPVDDDSLRMKAINRMTPTYKRAAYVIVLDSGLSAAPKRQVSTEKCADLLMSAWNGRSWTLQEGALARELQFPGSVCPAATFVWKDQTPYIASDRITGSEKLYPIGTLCSELAPNASHAFIYIHRHLHRAHQLPSVGRWKLARKIRHYFPHTNDQQDGASKLRESQFWMVWNALSGRTTTMVQDAHGILANLLDFKAEEILLLHQKERMRAILCAQERLPVDLLYDRSPRTLVASPLDRWAPDNPQSGMLLLDDTWMDVTREGFFISSKKILGRTILIQHTPRTFRLDHYYLQVESFGRIEVAHYSVPECSYPEVEYGTTLLHLVPEWRSILSSRLTVSGASFAVEKAETESFKVYYDDPVTLKLCESHAQNSSPLPFLDGIVISDPHTISIDIGIRNTYKPRYRRKLDGGIADLHYSSKMIILLVLLTLLSFVVTLIGFRFTEVVFVVPLVLLCCAIVVALFIFYFYLRISQGVSSRWLRTFDEL